MALLTSAGLFLPGRMNVLVRRFGLRPHVYYFKKDLPSSRLATAIFVLSNIAKTKNTQYVQREALAALSKWKRSGAGSFPESLTRSMVISCRRIHQVSTETNWLVSEQLSWWKPSRWSVFRIWETALSVYYSTTSHHRKLSVHLRVSEWFSLRDRPGNCCASQVKLFRPFAVFSQRTRSWSVLAAAPPPSLK